MSAEASALPASRSAPQPAVVRPQLGFAGVGWIGLNRLRHVAASGVAEVRAVADAAPEARRQAAAALPASVAVSPRFEDLLEAGLDGVVIATPSALHAQQARAALERGLAVFCQKPLARTAPEAAGVVRAAQRHDRLLGVDFCYRTLAGMRELRALIGSGALGSLYAVDLVFHNAYGPDKPWFYDPALAGGGCVMDLGIHLIDLLLWMLGNPAVEDVRSELRAGGQRLRQPAHELEDHAIAEIRLASGVTARLACSWRLPAGCDAVIGAAFYGTQGAGLLRNLNGSFYEFAVEHCQGTHRRELGGPPDDWGGRAVCAWAQQLARDCRFDASAHELLGVSALIDRIYGR